MTGKDIKHLIQRACHFEGLIQHTGATQVREQSKQLYGAELLDARLMLMAGFAYLFEVKSAQPGATSKAISDRLALIATFVQGLPAMESLISEGQYAKAAAAMKQDFEIVARLGEIEHGVAKAGKQPNVKYTGGAARFYGPLNNIAHPCNEDTLRGLLHRLEKGEVRGLSPVPALNEDAARGLYELHVFTMIEVLREAIALFIEMYPGDSSLADTAMRCFLVGTANAERAGFVVVPQAPAAEPR